MKGQVDKKRYIIIGGVKLRLKSRRIIINEYPNVTNIAKVMFNKIWYTFNIETGEIISQGETWTDVLNHTKDYLNNISIV
jgi:methyl coenzyme M reductase subunit D